MNKKFTEETALKIMRENNVGIDGKTLFVKQGLKGLKACSALDFLINHCGYKAYF